MRRPSILLTVRPWRAAIEAFVVSLLLWSLLLLFQNRLAPFNLELGITLLVGPGGMLVFAARLRLTQGRWWRQVRIELALVCALQCVLSCVILALNSVFIGVSLLSLPWENVGRGLLAIFGLLALDIGVFGVLRIGLRLVLFWNRLRRRQLLWALTHAHIMLVALGAGLLIVLFELLLVVRGQNLLYLIIPTTLGLGSLVFIALLMIIPPSALFSYLVVRRTVARIKTLAVATSALRVGNYETRVPVVGEDEVAQLQEDFNAMAADLGRAMRELQAERDTVAGLLQARRELVANVSHELRTPVATIRSYLETTLSRWEEGAPPPTLQQDMQVMEDEIIRLQALVDDLFTLARSEVGRLTLRCIPTDVGRLTLRIVEARAPLAWRSSRIEVASNVPDEGPYALIDPGRLEQVLQNLLHNGVRHTPPGGIVAVDVVSEFDAVVLHVKDTGEGIAPGDLPHIWERFYQTESARTHLGSGTGLGLALVKEWVEAMAGSVSVASVLDEGSCFTLRLPHAAAVSGMKPLFESAQGNPQIASSVVSESLPLKYGQERRLDAASVLRPMPSQGTAANEAV